MAPPAPGAAAHVHGGDVHVVAAEDGADLAHHARPVLVGEHEDVPLGDELDVEIPQADDARHAVEHGARDDLALPSPPGWSR